MKPCNEHEDAPDREERQLEHEGKLRSAVSESERTLSCVVPRTLGTVADVHRTDSDPGSDTEEHEDEDEDSQCGPLRPFASGRSWKCGSWDLAPQKICFATRST